MAFERLGGYWTRTLYIAFKVKYESASYIFAIEVSLLTSAIECVQPSIHDISAVRCRSLNYEMNFLWNIFGQYVHEVKSVIHRI